MEVFGEVVQILDQTGTFYDSQLAELQSGEDDSNDQCLVVSIIGPQSSGKSYLLNHLFGTKFKVLQDDWGQTTVGIWAARCTKPNMIIMDVEGCDSHNNAKVGTTFERQTALFALMVSDIMILNMKRQDFGRYEAGCKPLLQIIFQERVNLSRGKTRLVVILRDCNDQIGVEDHETDVITDLKMIWESVHPTHTNQMFDDYIDVSLEAFPYYEKPTFQQKCTEMVEKFVSGTFDGYRGHSSINFHSYAETVWDEIQAISALKVPPVQVMYETYMSKKIVDEIINSLESDEDFHSLKLAEDTIFPESFSEGLQKLLHSIRAQYHDKAKTIVKDKVMRKRGREELKSRVIVTLQAKCESIIERKCNGTIDENRRKIHKDLKKRKSPDVIIKEYMELFDGSTKGLPFEYQNFILEKRAELEKALEKHIEREEKLIRRNHAIVVGASTAVAATVILTTGVVGLGPALAYYMGELTVAEAVVAAGYTTGMAAVPSAVIGTATGVGTSVADGVKKAIRKFKKKKESQVEIVETTTDPIVCVKEDSDIEEENEEDGDFDFVACSSSNAEIKYDYERSDSSSD